MRSYKSAAMSSRISWGGRGLVDDEDFGARALLHGRQVAPALAQDAPAKSAGGGGGGVRRGVEVVDEVVDEVVEEVVEEVMVVEAVEVS